MKTSQVPKRVKVTHVGQSQQTNLNPQQHFYSGSAATSPPQPKSTSANSTTKNFAYKTFSPLEKARAKRRLTIFKGFAIPGFIIGLLFGFEVGLLGGLGLALLGAYWGGGFGLLLILALYLIKIALFFKIALIKPLTIAVAVISLFVTPFLLLHAMYILRDGKLPVVLRHIAQFAHVIYEWQQTVRSNP